MHNCLVIFFTDKCFMLSINISLTVVLFGEHKYHIRSLDVVWYCYDVPSTKVRGVETRLVEVYNKTSVLVVGKTYLMYDRATRYEEH
jgi:hypothetical protein